MNKNNILAFILLSLSFLMLSQTVWASEIQTLPNLTISTDEVEYFTGDSVLISGSLIQYDCEVPGEYVAIQVISPEGANFVAGQVYTNDYGNFLVVMTIPSEWSTGEYVVIAKTSGSMAVTTMFNVTNCDEDRDDYEAPACGGDDFDDNDASKYPGAPCERSGYTGSSYDVNGVCIGGSVISTPRPPSGSGTTGSGTTGSGGAPPCESDWVCTEWSYCSVKDTQGRTCTDINECGTEDDRPKEIQNCTFTGVLSSQICGDGICNGTESCDTCTPDCGECEPVDETSVCGDSVCDSDESCDTCTPDCGECETSDEPKVTGGEFGGLIPGGVTGLFGIVALIIVAVFIVFAFANRKKR